MIALLTSRAEIEILGKIHEKEDIIPVEFKRDSRNVLFKLMKDDFIYKLIKKSQIFALNIPRLPFEREADLCEMHEGMFEDKFKIAKLTKTECTTIDCPGIMKSEIIECRLLKEEDKKDYVMIYGEILTTKQA